MLEFVSLKIATVAVVYICILTQPGEILYMLRVLFTKADKGKDNWWFKILVGCEKCFAGQTAFWYYLACSKNYNVFEHIYFVSLTILMAFILKSILIKLY